MVTINTRLHLQCMATPKKKDSKRGAVVIK